MSARIPTDIFGRSMNLKELPFTTIEHTPAIDYDKVFVNAEGDKMQGNLDMGKNKITNISNPTSNFDCANKAYVDTIKSKTMSTLQDKFGKTVAEVSTKIAENRKQDSALKTIINKLTKRINDDLTIKKIKSKLVNTSHISTLVLTWDKGHSITKNILILQILIEGDKGTWLDLQALNYRYGFYVYERYNRKKLKFEYHISTERSLPKSWKCNLSISCKILPIKNE